MDHEATWLIVVLAGIAGLLAGIYLTLAWSVIRYKPDISEEDRQRAR
jgi:hypothetical protein